MKFGKMKPHRRDRLILVMVVVLFSGAAVGMILMALNENINLFYSPEQIVNGEVPTNQHISAGGMVKEGSVVRTGQDQDLMVRFIISDLKGAEVAVEYSGILPDLFREGKGAIAKGELSDSGVFKATEIQAKHDENYMSPEVASVLEEAHKKDEPYNKEETTP